MTPESLQILEPIGMAIVFSLLWYARSRDTETLNPDDWRWDKFLATLSVGIAVSLGMWTAGVDLSMVEFEARMATYAGTIVLIQGAIQAAYRNVANR